MFVDTLLVIFDKSFAISAIFNHDGYNLRRYICGLSTTNRRQYQPPHVNELTMYRLTVPKSGQMYCVTPSYYTGQQRTIAYLF
jgi:hypothetical protein